MSLPEILPVVPPPLSIIPGDPSPTPHVAEFDETLKRLVDRIARILQAEMCVFMLHDISSGHLYATEPALGISHEQIARFQRRLSGQTLTAMVFRKSEPVIVSDALTDFRAINDGLLEFGVRTSISVPLVVADREVFDGSAKGTTVGVLHVFNKKQHGVFSEEDLPLLVSMANQGAAVIAHAQIYREVVQEKQELIHTIDSLNSGLLMVGTQGKILQINPSARIILGIEPNVPINGLHYSRVIGDNRVGELLDRAFEEDSGEVTDEITVKFDDNSPDTAPADRIYQAQCATVRDDSNEPAGIVVIFTDITEIRSVERMKTAFMSTVSHELRTPLTSIKGFISTLLSDSDGFYDESMRREFYTIIDTECDRLTRLIKDLLDVSRIEQGRPLQMYWERVDIGAIAEKVITAQRSHVKGHELSLDFPIGIPLVEADPDKLDQIFTNLIDNAIKYSPRGGSVDVIGRFEPGIRLGNEITDCVTVKISDHGMGISKEHIPHLFERFYRVDNTDTREIGGTGIGLALVDALVKAHHGTVAIKSDIGKGTTFTVTLPITQPKTSEKSAITTL